MPLSEGLIMMLTRIDEPLFTVKYKPAEELRVVPDMTPIRAIPEELVVRHPIPRVLGPKRHQVRGTKFFRR